MGQKCIRSLLLCPDRSGLDRRVALRIWEVKYIGPVEGIDLGTDGEGGGQACTWGNWRSGDWLPANPMRSGRRRGKVRVKRR